MFATNQPNAPYLTAFVGRGEMLSYNQSKIQREGGEENKGDIVNGDDKQGKRRGKTSKKRDNPILHRPDEDPTG